MKVYLAGPLFSSQQASWNFEIARYLRDDGHEVFLPQEHEASGLSDFDIFEKDVSGLDWAEVVVANLDGLDADSGTCWELGYAFAKGKDTFWYRTDWRGEVNLMMSVSSQEIFLDLVPHQYVTAIYVSMKIDEALKAYDSTR